LTEKLVGTSAAKDSSQVVITSLDECTGDVDLNQRKGKLLAIYDVALKMSWQGSVYMRFYDMQHLNSANI